MPVLVFVREKDFFILLQQVIGSFFRVNVFKLQFFETCIWLKSVVIYYFECFRVPFRVFFQFSNKIIDKFGTTLKFVTFNVEMVWCCHIVFPGNIFSVIFKLFFIIFQRILLYILIILIKIWRSCFFYLVDWIQGNS